MTNSHINFPTEKRCGRCKEVKSWKVFYVVPTYPDNLSRLCKPCSSLDGQERQHRRQLKEQGREKFAERIAHLRALADAMDKILSEQ